MQTFTVPAWVWINLAILVAAAIYVALRIAAEEKAARRRPEPNRLRAGMRRAIN